jgi:cysteine desulfurase
MLQFYKNIAISAGSACTSGSLESSYVLNAMGLISDDVQASLRFSLGRFTTEEEIDFTIKTVSDAIHKLRSASPVWKIHKKESPHK